MCGRARRRPSPASPALRSCWGATSIGASCRARGGCAMCEDTPHMGRLRHVRGVLAGVLIAAPLLAIFAALFAEADEVFANVLRNLFALDAASIVQHTFFICFWGALTAGLLRWALLARPIATPRMDFMPASVTPFAVALGLLNALFLLFVVVQLRYFF